jgi:GTP-binding protein YchF
MKLGIVGLPNSGKTTLFNALTLGHAATSSFTAAQANRGVISVPDERLDRLHERLETPKKVNATIEVVDVPGMGGGTPGEGLGLRFLADIRGVDAVAHVLRAFEDPDVPHARHALDPIADAEDVETELVLSDLELVERRLQKTGKAAKAGDRTAQKEAATLERLAVALREGRRARSVEVTPEEEPLVRELALLSERPVLFVLNTGDEGGEPGDDLVAWAHARGDEVVAVSAKLEAELAELEPDDAAEFRADLGGAAPGLDHVIAAAYRVLGYITFFTGDHRSSESRAWQLPRRSNARQAAGRIHTDIMERFVRAEVVQLEALLEAGSFHAAREKGVLRVEGKDYIVQDADVINFRHTA